MKGGLDDLLKKAGEMQSQMKRVQDEIADTSVIGEAGAGMVKITVNGRHEVSDITIEQSVMTQDKSVLEDLLVAAVNDANTKLAEMNQNKLASIAGTVDLPFGMKLPF